MRHDVTVVLKKHISELYEIMKKYNASVIFYDIAALKDVLEHDN
jgi:hypothetical protein